MRVVLDTNILVDYFRGIKAAKAEIKLHDQATISIITWMEVLVGARSEEEERIIRAYLNRFQIFPVSNEVAEQAIALRRQQRIRLPDAIIWGTAKALGTLLVTRNTRDFPEKDPSIRVPYVLG